MKREKLNTIQFVLELECLESEQWPQQIRSFQAGQPGGVAAGNESLGQSMYTYVRLYRCINIPCQSVSIVYDGIYFISKRYTVINRHIKFHCDQPLHRGETRQLSPDHEGPG